MQMRTRRLINLAQERLPTAALRGALNSLLTLGLPKPLPLSVEDRPLLLQFQQDGNVRLPQLASIEKLKALRDELATQPCYDPWRPEIADFNVADTPEISNNARIRNVAQFPVALALANHPLVLSIVSQYLGCLPTIDDIVAWWSLPGRPAPKEEQFFHRDRDAVRFVKLFIYLSEVTKINGAHVFVQGSHRIDKLCQPRRRYQDQEVIKSFGEDKIQSITGAFGSAFIEDTYGIHKGTVPTGNTPRLLLQVRYTSYPSVWAGRERDNPPDGYNPYVNRLIA